MDPWTRAATMLEVVQDLAAREPLGDLGYDGEFQICVLCKQDDVAATLDRPGVQHTETCPWRRARDLIDRQGDEY